MGEQVPVLILLIPLFGAVASAFLGRIRAGWCGLVTLAALAGALASALVLLGRVLEEGAVSYFLAGWSTPLGIGIELRADAVNSAVVVLINLVALWTAWYARHRVPQETPGKEGVYSALFLLQVTGLSGMTLTADAFNLYVLLEVASLTGYALVAIGASRRAGHAAFNYIIMGTIGASLYLLGVGYLYIKTGSLNMLGIHDRLVEGGLLSSRTVDVAFVLILVGLWIKMAFFPLHGWLPNAYTHSPSSSGCLLAPLVTKVSIYVMARMMFTVFGVDYLAAAVSWTGVPLGLAVVAILSGSFLAMSQRELKKMLSFLIVAEVGYMVGGLWLLNRDGYVGALYHLLSDAVMTSLLFLSASVFFYRTGTHRIHALRGFFAGSPWVTGAFVVGAFSMVGIPPTCGFFSKWYLIRGAIAAGQWAFVVALLVSSLVNAVLFFRIFEIAYFRKPLPGRPEPRPVPVGMAAPLGVAAAAVLLLGWFNADVAAFLQRGAPDFTVLTAGPEEGGGGE